MTKRGAEEMLRAAQEADKEVSYTTQKMRQAEIIYEKRKEELFEKGGVWRLMIRAPHMAIGYKFFASRKEAALAFTNLSKVFNLMHTYHITKASYEDDSRDLIRDGLSSSSGHLFDTCQVIIVYQKAKPEIAAAYIPVPPKVSLDYTDMEGLLNASGRKASLVGGFAYTPPVYGHEDTKEDVLESLVKIIESK